MTEQELFALLGKFVALIASSAGGAFLLITLWGQKWIENKFSKDLELFKVQKLHEFDLLLTRKTKWHEKEHEVLSGAWKKLIKAHTALKQAIMAFKELPDLNKMSDEERNKFLESCDLSEDGRDYVKQSREDYNRAYSKALDFRSLHKAHEAFLEFHTYFDEHRIFLRPHIKEQFQKADDYIWSAWVSQKMSLRDHKFSLNAYEEGEKIKPLITEIENIVQGELFPDATKASEKSK